MPTTDRNAMGEASIIKDIADDAGVAELADAQGLRIIVAGNQLTCHMTDVQ